MGSNGFNSAAVEIKEVHIGYLEVKRAKVGFPWSVFVKDQTR